ncbi:hypothetical protein TSAR_016593 [Trichomalopsis sarcophagae]|uniref:TPPP family protein n=1 Tax=Trichomalopsis sarcophagae TaxID=543379 RepID=A0A232F244_9HYME|nr:hypothetical protein TSAR_016593 [Trichomalopsis sarcophagae]
MTDTDNVGKQEKETEVSLNEMFKVYCSLDAISREMNVKLLPLSQIDKWLYKAQILDLHNVTTTDTGLCFFKFRKRAINYEEFLEYIRDLANIKKLKLDDIKHKLRTCALPAEK